MQDNFNAEAAVSWNSRDLSLGEFLSTVDAFLLGLKQIDPIFSDLYVSDNRANQDVHLDDDLGNLERLGLTLAWDADDPKHWFTNLDEHGHPALASHSLSTGWDLEFLTEPEHEKTSRFALISIGDGWFHEETVTGSLRVSVQHPESPLITAEVSDRLFKYLVEFWTPGEASFTGSRFREATRNTLTREQLGWLNYRADPGYARYLPDSVHREPLGQGVFFRIGDGRVLTEEDTAEVRTALAIQAAIQNDAPPPK